MPNSIRKLIHYLKIDELKTRTIYLVILHVYAYRYLKHIYTHLSLHT